MSLPILKGLLQDFTKTLFEEGTVNDQFNVILALKCIGEPNYVVKLIEKYIADVGKIIYELCCHVDNPRVDFCKLASLTREIENKSASIGVEQMRLVCFDVIKACDEKHQNK
ncbi:Histidine-containing phosphotransfer protein 2, partial [Mucuna pruriens]